jgi:hypothetical protein
MNVLDLGTRLSHNEGILGGQIMGIFKTMVQASTTGQVFYRIKGKFVKIIKKLLLKEQAK